MGARIGCLQCNNPVCIALAPRSAAQSLVWCLPGCIVSTCWLWEASQHHQNKRDLMSTSMVPTSVEQRMEISAAARTSTAERRRLRFPMIQIDLLSRLVWACFNQLTKREFH